MDAEERRENAELYFGTADPAGPHCPECGSDDINWKTRSFEEPSGRVLDGETTFRCNHCEAEWIEA